MLQPRPNEKMHFHLPVLSLFIFITFFTFIFNFIYIFPFFFTSSPLFFLPYFMPFYFFFIFAYFFYLYLLYSILFYFTPFYPTLLHFYFLTSLLPHSSHFLPPAPFPQLLSEPITRLSSKIESSALVTDMHYVHMHNAYELHSLISCQPLSRCASHNAISTGVLLHGYVCAFA